MGDFAPADQNLQLAPPDDGTSLFGGVLGRLTLEQLLLFNSKELPKVSKTAPIFDKDVPAECKVSNQFRPKVTKGTLLNPHILHCILVNC